MRRFYAFSPFLALGIAFVLSPLLAIATKGRYYIAHVDDLRTDDPEAQAATLECVSCAQPYETPDMATCPHHGGTICSLCCTLEKNCHDVCKAAVEFVDLRPSGGLSHAAQ